jgi:anti-anti-sigma factor
VLAGAPAGAPGITVAEWHAAVEISRLAAHMQTEFRLETSNRNGASVISIFGELDLATSPGLEEELERVAGEDVPLVIVDLAELEFMDSTGLSVLVRAHQRAEETGQRFGLINSSQQVQRLLTLTGVRDRLVLEEIPELDDA